MREPCTGLLTSEFCWGWRTGRAGRRETVPWLVVAAEGFGDRSGLGSQEVAKGVLMMRSVRFARNRRSRRSCGGNKTGGGRTSITSMQKFSRSKPFFLTAKTYRGGRERSVRCGVWEAACTIEQRRRTLFTNNGRYSLSELVPGNTAGGLELADNAGGRRC